MPVTTKDGNLSGTLLIASLNQESQVFDKTFVRSVILVLEHSADTGAIGVIINRPLGENMRLYSPEALQEFVEGLETLQSGTETRNLFFQGGPVQQDRLIFLHQLQELIPSSTQICGKLFVGGELEALREHTDIVTSDKPVLRFYLGYAGWEKEQLEAEIERGDWILAPGKSEFVLSPQPKRIWQDVLYALGGKYRPMSLLPQDPIVN